MRNKFFFVPHKDSKSKMWIMNNHKDNVIQLEKSPFFYFCTIFSHSILNNTKPIFYFRYLNDHKNWLVHCLRVISDILLILVCRIFGGEIRWIAHNIDQDTLVFHPVINKFRRKIVAHFAKKIFVTDYELMDYGIKKIGYEEKLDFISFGYTDKRSIDPINYQISKEIEKIPDNILLGLCATALVGKCVHLFEMEKILNEANSNQQFRLCIIVVADFSKCDLEFSSLLEKLSSREDIIIFPRGGVVNEHYLSNKIDFVYRSLSDYSVPLSIYNSASAKIPILTHNIGFCGSLVDSASLGYVIDKEFDISEFKNFIFRWDCRHAENFLSKRTWIKATEKLFDHHC